MLHIPSHGSSTRRKRTGAVGALGRFVVCLSAAFLAGCASTVYKNHAGEVAAASGALSTALGDATARLGKEIDDERLESLVQTPGMCPGAPNRLPLYFAAPAVVGKPLADIRALKVIGQTESPECSSLMSCTVNCTAVRCLSSAEQTCVRLVTLQLKELAAVPQDKVQVLAQHTKSLKLALQGGQFPGAKLTQIDVVTDALEDLSAYVAVLAELAQDNQPVAKAQATRLVTNLSKLKGNLEAVAATSAAAQVNALSAQANKWLVPIATLIDTVSTLAKDKADAQEIKKQVRDNGAAFDDAAQQLKAYAAIDEKLALTWSANALRNKQKDSWKTVFDASTSPARRREVLQALLLNHQDSTKTHGPLIEKAVDAMVEAHSALRELIENPSDQQKQQIADARMDSFKRVLKDVAALAQL